MVGYDIGDLSCIPSSDKERNEFDKELLIKIKNGKDVEENQELLFKSVYRLGVNYLKRYSNLEEDINELLPLMSIAFMKSINKYEIGQKFPFLQLFYLGIKEEVIHEYYHQVDNKRELKSKYKREEVYLDGENSESEEKNSLYRIISSNENVENKVIETEMFNILETIIEDVCEVKRSNYDIAQGRDRRTKEAIEKGKRNEKIVKSYILNDIKDIEKVSSTELGRIYGLNHRTINRMINQKKEMIKEKLINLGIVVDKV